MRQNKNFSRQVCLGHNGSRAEWNDRDDRDDWDDWDDRDDLQIESVHAKKRELRDRGSLRLSQVNVTEIRKARDALTAMLGGWRTDLADAAPYADGRYEGGNHLLALDLRVDFDGSGVVSGDLFGRASGRLDYLASFRTAPGLALFPEKPQPWPIIVEGAHTAPATGLATLEGRAGASALRLTLHIAGAIPGLPSHADFEMSAEWASEHLRSLAIELERESGTEAPPTVTHDGEPMSIRHALEGAGIETYAAGSQSLIPRETGGWGIAQLHALMVDLTDASLNRPEWRQQLLWLDKPTRRGLLGVMFDSTAPLPRQGTAVFDGEIRETGHDPIERKLIQTAVHEIGHGLNLAHRFEREVGRAHSVSFMNYDWRYRGGRRSSEFWSKFDYAFDADELEFLRHAPRKSVIPGGAPFHSVNYWADGDGGYSPYVPEEPLDLIKLELKAPLAGPTFAFGQPVLLGVSLTNRMGRPLDLDPHLLDPKTGSLEILVRRISGGGNSAAHFHPIVERCFDVQPGAATFVAPGSVLTNNLNITFGSGGFTFAEPGTYEIRAVVAVYDGRGDRDPSNDRELIVPSAPLKIHVAHPQSLAEENEVVDVLHRTDVGVWFALGGSSALDQAEADLKAVLDRRTDGGDRLIDPVAANIVRCQGINAGRRYKRFSLTRRRPYYTDGGDREAAAGLLSRLDKRALAVFDHETAAGTRSLRDKHLAAARG